ncbi:H-type lectin domain protein (macronuclear) [Tetrahymena thermophila SB210]|uniref:H-type lectin domain protein n=1 Tax=Tetrahymena thermophila (strain SB210) TaxID=312017 RepID=I7MMX9_TETTS|nr:H-type lectin domain protein [Tetrahymena thermophila SB210]EAS07188.2 H-type lectin domain protein [Tetrahymena thermophila SB210]|eukprot:XP_001027430.2 H-type lectin domain protein [Tetrahymena thermophila SB210]
MNVQSFNFGSSSTQQYQLNLKAISQNSVTIEVQSVDNSSILDLMIGILAVDYPCVKTIKNTITKSNPTFLHTFEQNIYQYAAFFTSFQSEQYAQLQFDFNSKKVDNHNIQIQAANFQGVNSIDYNLIVFYCDINNFKDSPLYDYQITNFDNIMSGTTLVSTKLQKPSTGFYGINSMNLKNSFKTYSIFFKLKDPQNPILTGQYQFSSEIVKANNITFQTVSYLNSQVFDLVKLICPEGQYLYNKSCILPSTEGVYCQNNPNICYDCQTNCKTCDTSANNCLSCKQNKYFFENQCYDNQQDGTYCINYMCYRCSKQCKQCQNNQDFCTQCYDFQFLFNNSCYIQKPSQAYCKQRKNKII